MAYLIDLGFHERAPSFEFLDEPDEMFLFGISHGLKI